MTVQMELDRLNEASGNETGSPYHSVLKAMASILLMIVDGVSKIVVEQGLDDGGILNEIPPVPPVDLCGMTPRDFAKALQNQKDVSWLRCRKKILRRLMPNSDASETPTTKRRA